MIIYVGFTETSDCIINMCIINIFINQCNIYLDSSSIEESLGL